MFDTNESVNQLLNYSKLLLDQMNDGKNFCGRFKEMQYLTFAGMIAYYGFDAIDEIYGVFNKTFFTYSNEPMEDILVSNGFSIDTILPIAGKNKMPANFNRRLLMDMSGRRFLEDYIFVSTNYDLEPIELLEVFVHECNHAVNSVNREIFSKNDRDFIRFGLNVRGLLDSYDDGSLLEECINVLQTAEIVNEILKFTKFDIEDPIIANAINNIKYAGDTKRKGLGYEFIVPFIKPLYDNSNFNRVVKEARMSGDIDKIDWEFDRKAGENKFYELKQVTDETLKNPYFLSQSHAKVKTLVYSYLNN